MSFDPPSGTLELLNWPAAEPLLRGFPVALARVGADGVLNWTNARFDALYRRDVTSLSAVVPGVPVRAVMPRRDGGTADVLAHRLSLDGGWLLVIDDTPTPANVEDVRALRLRLADLERENLVDALTGAWNRRYLDRAMAAELSRAERYRHPLSVMLFDIDFFKRINDEHGHQAGDTVLKELAGVTRTGMRATDALVRWGGEEFLVLMPYTAHGMAQRAAENLRRRIGGHPFTGVGRITVSIGVVEWNEGESAGALFLRADRAMYRAKAAGRDRVVADDAGASDVWAGLATASPIQLVWQDAYACGEPTIDAQHRELFRLGNALLEASLRAKEEPARFMAALEACLAHVVRHFADEEALLAQHGFPGLAGHQDGHRALLERAAALHESARRGEADTGLLVDFLAQEVVLRHLLTSDRAYYPLFGAIDASNIRS